MGRSRVALSAHLVRGAKVVPRVRDELLVGRVVDRLDADDLRNERVMALVHILDEFELRRSGARDEDLFHSVQCMGDVVIESLRIRWMASLGRHLRVPVNVMMRGLEGGGVETLRVQEENLGFVVIDPNGSVSSRHGPTLSKTRAGFQAEIGPVSPRETGRTAARCRCRFGEKREFAELLAP